MRKRFPYILRLALVVGAAVTLAACGGGALAPTGGGGTPVAIEIPALGDVSGLPFASGIVVTGSSNIAVALKATPSSWVAKTFNLTTDTFVAGDSRLACEYRNSAGIAWGAMTLPDESLCIIKDKIAQFTTPYDGSYHILSTGASFPGFPSLVKFKFIRNSSSIITDYEEFTCDSTNTQMTYVSYAITDSALTATLKSIRTQEPQRSLVNLTGTLSASDPTQFTDKSGTYSYTGTNDSGALEGALSVTQGVDYLLLDAFDSRGDGGNINRIYAQADQSNDSSPFTISGYTYGAGAAYFIGSDLTSTGCWNGTTNDPEACSGRNSDAISGKPPQVASTQTVSSFSGSTAWDCAGTVEVTSTFSESDLADPTSCANRFSLDSQYIDCATATQGSVTVTPSVGGTTLSTDANAPTTVITAPSIVLTASRGLDSSSANSDTVTLVNNGTGSSVTLTYTGNWNSDNTTLTLSPALDFGETYKLTLVGSSNTATQGTVLRSPSGTPPADQLQSTATYYIRLVAWFDVAWTQQVAVTVDNASASVLTNDQVSTTLNTAGLVTANLMRSDCGDLRVTDSDRTTLVNFWIVDGTCNTPSTQIWTKVPSVPANSTTSIYLYYGNAVATSISSWDNTILPYSDTQLTSNFGSPRYGGGMLNYDGKLWIFGGRINGNVNGSRVNDVWSSTDGVSWSQIAATSSWGARNEFGYLVFNNKMWILGGRLDGSVYKNDVWSSTDGVTWTQETAAANWGIRNSFGYTVFNNKMWIMGGNSGTNKNDVWSSSDGITWTQETAAANWPIRQLFPMTTFNDKMWIFGGAGATTYNDVWSSSDGITWTQETAAAAWSIRNGSRAAVLDGKMWIAGGFGSSVYKNDLWYSSDGITWTSAITNGNWQARSSWMMTVWNDKLILAGGYTGSSFLTDVWQMMRTYR